MRHATERHAQIAKALKDKHDAHIAGDRAAYNDACERHEAAQAMPDVYECPCGKEWDGSGRLTIGYTAAIEDQDGNLVRLQSLDRADEHVMNFCPDCKAKILPHLNKR